LWLERPPGRSQRPRITSATRIGVDYAGDWAKRPWRYFDSASPYVSTAPAKNRRRLLAPAGKIEEVALQENSAPVDKQRTRPRNGN
jgi:hypothetical protein